MQSVCPMSLDFLKQLLQCRSKFSETPIIQVVQQNSINIQMRHNCDDEFLRSDARAMETVLFASLLELCFGTKVLL